MKDKIISFPVEVLDALEDYKNKTGIPATDYIRRAVVKQMIIEGLIWIETKRIIVETKENGKKYKIDTDAIEGNKFCDGDRCEVPVIRDKC